MSENQPMDRRLMDRVRVQESHGRLLGFVATTFEMQVEFFETDFLPTLFGLGAWDDRNWSSRVALERHLAELETATLFQDSRPYNGRPRSMRIETVPVYLPGMSILHSKVLVAVYEHGVKLFIGSNNMTEPGYRRNLETAAVLTVDSDNHQNARLVQQAIKDFQSYLSDWLTPGSSQLLGYAVGWLDQIGGTLPITDWIVWSGQGEPLWKKFMDKWPGNKQVEKITVVSPFWSEETKDGPICNLVSQLRRRNQIVDNARLSLVACGAKQGDDYMPMLPDSFCHINFEQLGVNAVAQSVDPVVPGSEVDIEGDLQFTRSLHAKIVVFESSDTSLAYFGSANFTRHGWGFLTGAQSPNIEAGVVVLSTPENTDRLIPKTTGEPVQLTLDGQVKLAPPEPEPDANPWPSFIQRIVLESDSADSSQLRLTIVVNEKKVLGDWGIEIDTTGGNKKFSCLDDKHGNYSVSLGAEEIIDVLKAQEVTIKWWDNGSGRRFPVNVSLDARANLPVSPNSGNPKEHHLIAYYQGRIRWEDLFPEPDGFEEFEKSFLDEADKSSVDTSQIQSYIVREFVEALKGINDDLKSAAQSTKGAMRLALLGSVSPLALARHVHDAAIQGERTATATGFQLVEIIGCLNAASNYRASEQFRKDWLTLIKESESQVRLLLDDLKKRFPSALAGQFQLYAEQIINHQNKNNPVAR